MTKWQKYPDKSYKIITTTNPLKTGSEIEYYEDDNQKLAITQRVNSFVRIYKNPMSEIYCNRKWAFWVTFISSMIVLGIDACTLLI